MKNKKAFTMIELIFVIILLGIISAMTIPFVITDGSDTQSKALSSKLISDFQIIELKNNDCYDTYGYWLTTDGTGTALTSTKVDVSTLYCVGISSSSPIEGLNRFFTPKAPTGFDTYQMSAPSVGQIAITLTWSSKLTKIMQNAITDISNKISNSKFTSSSITSNTGTLTYFITK